MQLLSDFWRLVGLKRRDNDMTVFLRAVCDETGTDGEHDYVVAAGCVGLDIEWVAIECEWDKYIKHEHIKYFHAVEFNNKRGQFKGWKGSRRRKFYNNLSEIVDKSPIYQVVAAVNKVDHKAVKDSMHGMKGMRLLSDYGLSFLMYLIYICDTCVAGYGRNVRIKFVLESGPGISGIQDLYEELRGGEYADILGPLAIAKKEDLIRGVEIADYITSASFPPSGKVMPSDIFRL